eukprot:2622445-Prorocentrum_lima.AAC.1
MGSSFPYLASTKQKSPLRSPNLGLSRTFMKWAPIVKMILSSWYGTSLIGTSMCQRAGWSRTI